MHFEVQANPFKPLSITVGRMKTVNHLLLISTHPDKLLEDHLINVADIACQNVITGSVTILANMTNPL